MIALLVDHLWQSTLFAGVAGLLTLAFRRNSARVRYGLWFAASLKFLLPFAALAAVASRLAVRLDPIVSQPDIIRGAEQIAEPFASGARSPVAAALPAHLPASLWAFLPAALACAWGLGFATLLAVWALRWMRLRAAVRDSSPLMLEAPIPARSSRAMVEPGLAGLWRPVLVFPETIATQLSPAEIEAVVAHELCHLRRHDNLTAAVHMLVEAVFWFHPLVWWLGARLIEERERACDEGVVRGGHDPGLYAGAILKVCRLYLQSPIACAAGVSGADLKARMETIMTMQPSERLSLAKTLLLVSVAAISIAGPFAAGLLAPAPAVAQSQAISADDLSADRIAQRRAEQAEPRKAVSFDPKAFDRFVGYYQLTPTVVFTISRDGEAFFTRLTGQDPVEVFPESPTKFFAKVVPAQISFVANGSGPASELVLHQNGLEQHAKRISEASAKTIQAALDKRIEANKPGPGTEAWLRKYLASLEAGQPAYDAMLPPLQAAARSQNVMMKQNVKRWGPLKDVTFKNVNPGGADVYALDFQNAKVRATITQLTPDGKVGGLRFQDLP